MSPLWESRSSPTATSASASSIGAQARVRSRRAFRQGDRDVPRDGHAVPAGADEGASLSIAALIPVSFAPESKVSLLVQPRIGLEAEISVKLPWKPLLPSPWGEFKTAQTLGEKPGIYCVRLGG